MPKDDSLKERKTRLKKLEQIKSLGLNPYPNKFSRTHLISEALKLKLDTTGIKLAGRLLTLRVMGKLTFAHLQDASGKMQLAFKQDTLGQAKYQFLDLLNSGDIIGVSGRLFKTQKGEITLAVRDYELLTKALLPLPAKWHGLKDLELRYRKRYLDLIANPAVKDLFIKRSEFIKNIRSYLERQSFTEVETPVLELVPGGADAQPFITHHHTLDIDLYLRISLELPLKRLIIGGFEKIFEISKVFRNEGMSTQHLQEFTELEFYVAYEDYNFLMKFIEDFYVEVIEKTFGKLKFNYDNQEIDFKLPWSKVDYVQAIEKATGLDVISASDEEIRETIKKYKIDTSVKLGRGRLIDQLYKKMIRPKLIQPTFLINLPVSVSPLAKASFQNSQLAERIVVVAGGVEIGNGFSELNDPLDQQQRFAEQAKLRAAGDLEAQMMDKDFIEALEYGMPPTAGFGTGLDRLFMILAEANSIRDVVLFPTMKEK